MTFGLGPRGVGVLRMLRQGVLIHWCDACQAGHTIDIHALSQDGHVIGWDGDVERPSIGETLRVDKDGHVCEYRLRAGVMYFFSSCTHALAGQQRTLREYPVEALNQDQFGELR